ncbi:hypothetical protein FOL47_009612 [Perkinsus chesapeaki]|uniref:Protein phosphatase inhibitor 2 n=1 Tax=Perkinsus chesapeaki TaxID=330153 RepID=A0A7J6L795_PERCH|nr:hypothetical protein FOL47_009612 [Perkinsus chesapeaki]
MKDSDKDDEKRRIRFGGDDSPQQDHIRLGQPSRPALVTSPDHARNVGRKIRFDEAAIAEHDLERGTRMTIDEPDTPFVRTPMSSGESSEDSSSTYGGRGEHVRLGEVSREARLQNLTNGVVDHTAAAAEEQEGASSSLGFRNGLRIDFSSTEAEEAEELERERKAREFHEKRRKHYNEMQMVRALRAQGRLDTSEEEDDAERQQQQAVGEPPENCRHVSNPY